jgi:hypothetical protein
MVLADGRVMSDLGNGGYADVECVSCADHGLEKGGEDCM